MAKYNGVTVEPGARLPGLLPSSWWNCEERKDGARSPKADPAMVRATVVAVYERYAVVEFSMPGGSFRECFSLVGGELV